jgi:cystathionine beta-lyase
MSRFDEVFERRGTNSLKWDYCKERFGKADILPMWVADMDFASPPEVYRDILTRVEHKVYGYTEVSNELNIAIKNWNLKRNNWNIDVDCIVHTTGVVTSINTAVLAFTKENDKVLIQTPVYYPFYSCIEDNGRILIKNSLENIDAYYRINFEDLEKKLREGVKMMIFCSPHNPIGRVWKDSELQQVAQLCLENNVLLVSDEIHSDLVFSGSKHIPIASLSEQMRNNCITLNSPSKTFNLAGLAHSMAFIQNAVLREKFIKTMNRTGANMLNIFGLTATHAAYKYGEMWLDELMHYLSENLRILTEYFEKNIPEIKVIKPESTYLAWLDCRELSKKVDNLKEFFVQKAGIGLNDGVIFGIEGKGYQRINFACPRAILLEGLQAIEKAVKNN